MKQIIAAILWLVAVGCQAQEVSRVMNLHMFNEQGDFFCGETLVELKVTPKTVDMVSAYGELHIYLLAKDIGEFGAYRYKDNQGNLYTVVAIENPGTGGVGLEFKPDDSMSITFRIANQNLCGN